jgi:hypothetical protein
MEIIRYLIEEIGCDAECRESAALSTPLHMAVMRGNADVLRYLVLERGVNVAVRLGEGAHTWYKLNAFEFHGFRCQVGG